MKKILVLICALLFLGGCTPKEYLRQLENGEEELKNGNYEESIESFEKAKAKKETNTVNKLLNISNLLNESKTALENGEFEISIYNAKKIKGIKNMGKYEEIATKNADQLIQESNKLLTIKKEIESSIQKGKTLLEQNKFDEAYNTFKQAKNNELKEKNFFIDVQSSLTELMQQSIEAKKTYNEKIEAEKELAEAKKKEEAKKRAEEEKKKQEEADKTLTHKQAEDLVRQYLDIKPNPNVFVEYDHDEGNNFIIHVYEVVVDDPNTMEGHTATWGWYGVNKNSRIVYDAFNY